MIVSFFRPSSDVLQTFSYSIVCDFINFDSFLFYFLYIENMILYWKPVAEEIKNRLKNQFLKSEWQGKFITIFLLNNHWPSIKHVNLKRKFWEEVGLKVNVIDWTQVCKFEDIIKKIDELNQNDNCVGMIVQLPLPEYLKPFKSQILSRIVWYKDIDWLGGVNFWYNLVGLIDFVPATPKAVLNLLSYYWFSNFKWKKICILWQSNLVWKPLALQFMKMNAEVFSFNRFWDLGFIKKICCESDFIISATWNSLFVDDSFIRDDKSQVLVDVWWEIVNWKSVWDVNFEKVKDKVKAITPVPGGVWPVTVASLFENVVKLRKFANLLTWKFEVIWF